MKILGINHDMYITSAALFLDGKCEAAVAEERLTREKRSRAFPSRAIEYCLKQVGISFEELDFIANAYNPAIHMNKFNPPFSQSRRERADYLYSVPDHLLAFTNDRDNLCPDHMLQELPLNSGGTMRTYFITHHLCHAANGYFFSPFDEAAILTVDGRGEHDTVCFLVGEGNNIRNIKRQAIPHSLGSFYSTFTSFLGFHADSDEWKVMALSSFADGKNSCYGKIRSLVRLLEGGGFELDLTYFTEFVHELPGYFSNKLQDLIGPPRLPHEPIKQRHFEIAAAMQQVCEETCLHMLTWLQAETGLKKVALSGGMFMNSVFNGKITRMTPFEEAYLSSCPDDSGLSLGAAAYVHHHLLGNEERHVIKHNYFGPEFSDEAVEKTLKQYKIQYRKEKNIEKWTANALADEKLVGWFQGAMEFGQRALGNRSILADPRSETVKDTVNIAVKYRESFRPFAPAIKEEDVRAYFEIPEGEMVPFMEKVFDVRPEKRNLIPAVTHIDGSGRLQTVSRETNPKFHGLISEFELKTGIPVLLNTSFNLNGEPIVCSPVDAIRTFHSCGLDVLILNNFVVSKT